jgi:adenylate kinase
MAGPEIAFACEVEPGIELGGHWAWERVLINLFLNAMRAMPAGGTINVRARRLDGQIEIVVRDEGSGIAPEVLDHLFLPHVSTGEMLRAAVAKGTEMGLEAQKYMESGKLVPDEVVIGVVRDRLAEPDAAEGFLLDGYPRTLPQVDALDAMLAEDGHALDAVLELTVDEDAVVQRLIKRAEIEGRSDDTEQVIRERQAIYRKETAPLAALYGQRGLLVQVDGMGEVDEVTARIEHALRGAQGS